MSAPIELPELLGRVRQLPALPDVVVKVLQTFAEEDPDLDRLVREIAHDQALVTRVLRLANSPFYGLQSRVGTLHDAITVLGFRNVRAAVAGVAVMRCFAAPRYADFDSTAFWNHSTAVALAARAVARIARQPEELAFTAGLVHDVGVLALLTAFPDRMAAVLSYGRQHDCFIREAERDVLGLDHAVAGEALLRHWHFPEPICAAVLGHHDPEEIGSLADVVHVADIVAHAVAAAEHAGGHVPPLAEVAFNRLGLGVVKLKRVMQEVARDFEPACQALAP